MKTKTEELREKWKDSINSFIWERSFVDALDACKASGSLDVVGILDLPCIEQAYKQFLQACKDLGLAFVVKDAEIPRAEMPRYPIDSKAKAYRYGVEDQCRLQARAGFKMWEEIKL